MENIKKIFEDVADIIEKKNHDYDHAFDKSVDMDGYGYAASKILEKAHRIHTLSHTEGMVQGESLKDALKDCIGYCALYLDRIDRDEKREEEEGDTMEIVMGGKHYLVTPSDNCKGCIFLDDDAYDVRCGNQHLCTQFGFKYIKEID